MGKSEDKEGGTSYGLGKGYSDACTDTEQQHGKLPKWWKVSLWQPGYLKIFAKYAPLVAAIFAPLATLLDIPALSERWYNFNGEPQADPTACLALSAVGLALNIVANILLIMRFSSHQKFWVRHMTVWSLVCWCGKTAVAAVNLILFGILTRNDAGYEYTEGFWCAVVSLIDAGIIAFALLLHFFLAFRSAGGDSVEVRIEGRKFMVSVQLFIGILALQALAFNRLEGWSYSDAIYFSVQTALTIGYGDLTPTTTAGKVLIFPFAVLTISQLGNEIAQIIAFMAGRADARRDKWRRKYEGMMHREANKLRPSATLIEEMALIQEINHREEWMSQVYDLFWSAFSLVVFWVVGAAMFSCIEGWTYGNGMYAVMIMSLTIGFGDYTPEQPAGRVVFIVYALMAVPIVTSFAVQSITGLLSTYSARSSARDAFLRDRRNHPDAFKPHSEFVMRAHESYGQMRQRLLGETSCLPDTQGGEYAPEQDGGMSAQSLNQRGTREVGDAEEAAYQVAAGGKHQPFAQRLHDKFHAKRVQHKIRQDRKILESEATTAEPEELDRTRSNEDTESRSAVPASAVPARQRAMSMSSSAHFAQGQERRASGSKNRRHGWSSRKASMRGLLREWNEAAEAHAREHGLTPEEEKIKKQYERVTRILERRKKKRSGAGGRGSRVAKSGEPRLRARSGTGGSSRPGDIAEEEDQDGSLVAGDASANTAIDDADGVRAESEAKSGRSRLRSEVGSQRNRGSGQIADLEEEQEEDDDDDEQDARELELDLTRRMMELIVKLEAEARQMLLDSMDRSVARTLLLADRNVQVRDVRSMIGEQAPILAVWHGEAERANPASPSQRDHQSESSSTVPPDSPRQTHEKRSSQHDEHAHHPQGKEKEKQQHAQPQHPARHREAYALNPLPPDEAPSMLDRVKAYRNTFAEILVIGSILQKLEGDELRAFERFRLEEAQRDLRRRGGGGDGGGGGGGGGRSGGMPNRRETMTAPPDSGAAEAGVAEHGPAPGAGTGEDDLVALEEVADERWDGITGRVLRKEGKRLKNLLSGGGRREGDKGDRDGKSMKRRAMTTG